MAKDKKRRLLNKKLKREGVGMKYKKRKGNLESWQEKYNLIVKK